VKFTNELSTGAAGDLFLPVDKSIMGAGEGPLNPDGSPCDPETEDCAEYTENRSISHLHGGATPWISDGTPHQWITPAGETTPYPEGVSVENVPDMPDPGDGSQTFFYTNQQSARLMFYHDHSYGITRLNVYAGEAAPYVLQDPVEQQLVTDGIIPADEIPLVIQDKTFVPDETQLEAQDPTWDMANWGGKGSLWLPHVYMPAQNPADPGGMNAMGRWHYGPWFWPPTTGISHLPIFNPLYDCGDDGDCTRPWEPEFMPATPNPSWGAESFMDTPVVNGTAYPTLNVDPKAYRFRILNAANDRFWNLQIYQADPDAISRDGRQGTEVRMVPAVDTPGFPADWPKDGRDGGVPDPALMGPQMIQIANEGGFLPAPVVHPNQPIDWNLDPTTFNFGNVSSKNLVVGTAERADVIIDFSEYAGQTLILYNDAPTAFPALDARYDYFTGASDKTDTGGAPSTVPGFGPNTRTVMQIKVADAEPEPAFDLDALNAAFASTPTTEGAYAASQDPVLVPQSGYNSAYNATYPDTSAHIYDTSLTFTPQGSATPITIPFEPKAIQDEMGETFDDYGRMSANIGLSIPFTQAGQRGFVLENFVDPSTEVIKANITPLAPAADDGTQIWQITQNGVDTHTIHFHLFNVQLINRVAWDGSISMPDPNELGWKETVRVNPLEDTIVALRPVFPTLPFAVPDSVRPLNPALPIGAMMGFTNVDPNSGAPFEVEPVTNQLFNFGWEYVWHCHLLAHEENDMMRSMVLSATMEWPSNLQVTVTPGDPSTADLSWTDNSEDETSFVIQQSEESDTGPWTTLATVPAEAGTGNTVQYTDPNANSLAGTRYYRVFAANTTGAPVTGGAPDFASPIALIAFSNVASAVLP
jgi:FtsP/CotA-like multicopper oxidase with cupredoxin domain